MPTAPRQHRPITQPQQRPSERYRGSASERGYDAQWVKVSRLVRQRDKYLCQPCLKRGATTPAKIVDHILPLHIRPDWRLLKENLQVICPSHHTDKTNRDNDRYGSSTATSLNAQQAANRRWAEGLSEPMGMDPLA